MKMIRRKKSDTAKSEKQMTYNQISATSINSGFIFAWNVKMDQMTLAVSSVFSIILPLYSLRFAYVLISHLCFFKYS